jgi:hypothetical protein
MAEAAVAHVTQIGNNALAVDDLDRRFVDELADSLLNISHSRWTTGFHPGIEILDLNVLDHLDKRLALFCTFYLIDLKTDHARLLHGGAVLEHVGADPGFGFGVIATVSATYQREIA